MYATKADLELRYGVPEVAQLERGRMQGLGRTVRFLRQKMLHF